MRLPYLEFPGVNNPANVGDAEYLYKPHNISPLPDVFIGDVPDPH
jgi:hypothetical protein